jgi:putative hydrolase of the HAD superfamily
MAFYRVSPEEVLYVGNDMRNDIMPATKVGFQGVLFAGDSRSLRLRQKDASCANLIPKATITELNQIFDILY